MTGALVALSSITAFAFGIYAFTGMARRFTPFMSIIILGDLITVLSLFDMLKPGVLVAFFISWAVFVCGLYKNKDKLKQKITEFFSAPVVMFILSSVIMLVILGCTQPVFHDWDEFSFWGMARKILNKFDALYTYHNTSMLGQSIPPAMPVLTYFFDYFNKAFTEWVCYYAYDVLFLACFAAFAGVCGKKQEHISVMVFITAATLPIIFDVTEISSRLSSAYISTYGDMPMAFVFAGGIAVYLGQDKNTFADIMPVLPVTVFLTLIKDMGFALSCIIVFIIFFDLLVAKKQFFVRKIKGFAAKCIAAASVLAVTLLSYIGWSIHLANVINVNRSEFSETATVSMAGMLISGVKELLSPIKSEKFSAIYSSMISAFFDTRISIFGSGFRVLLVISVIFAIAVVLQKQDKMRRIVAYCTSLTGFAGYYIFHIFLYVYVFKNDAYTLPSYARYMNIYYAAWFVLALMLLAISVKNSGLLSHLTVFSLGLGCLLLISIYTTPGNLFTSVSADSFPKRQLIQKKTEYLKDVIGPNDVIYILSEDNAGENWFLYSFELLDNYLVKDNGLFGADSDPEEDRIIIKEISRYMKKNGATHILVDNINPLVCRRYNHLFDRSIGDMAFDRVGYYKINYTDEGFNFTIIKWGRTG